MKQYRARLENGRIIGPFNLEGIEELAKKGRLKGNEHFQEFPVGDWAELNSYPDVANAVETGKASIDNEATFVRKLSDFEKGFLDPHESVSENQSPSEKDETGQFPKEFNFDLPQESEEETTPVEPVEDKVEDETTAENPEEEALEAEPEETELRTKAIFRRGEEDAQDKTRITPATLKYLEEMRKKEEEEKLLQESEQDAEEGEPEEEQIDLEKDETQMVSLEELKSSVETEAKQGEAELAKEAQLILQEKSYEIEKAPSKEVESPKEKTPRKRKKILVYASILLLVVFFILPDESGRKPSGEPKIIYPQITFPQRYDKPDLKKAQALYKKAALEESKGDYLSLARAANAYRASLENQWEDNPAAGRLIFVYSRLLKHSDIRMDDANRVFKLIQIFNLRATKDPPMAAGMGLFYLEIGKAQAAVKTIEKFNTVNSKPSVDLFAVYLRALVENGDLIKAKAVEKKLSSAKAKTLFSNLSLIDYHIFKGDYARASKILAESLEKHGEMTSLLTRQAKLLLYDEDFKSLEILLAKLKKSNYGNSRVYYSQYLEYRGLLAAKNGNPKLALTAFKKALDVRESVELRSRLASLSAESDEETNKLINESKAVELIAKSKAHWKNDNTKFAFQDALEAVSLAPHYLPAKLNLAALQIKRSFFEEAIESLEELYEKHPHNPQVVFSLIDAYIEAYKFGKVKKTLNILASSSLRNEPEYYAKMAKFFVYKDEFKGAVMWLEESINRNPLNDENIYELAKMFIRYRKYNQGKILLNKAMELDPANVDYRVSYADILYETDSASAAIGYLYDVLRDFPDNAKILSAIGIYYYRSGQIKMFQATKEKLLALPDKDTAMFEFLIRAAKLDEKYEDVVKYAQKLIEVNPGDLRTRMFLGQIFMEMSKYEEALVQFNAVKERLESYPKLQYFRSKLFLLTDNVEKATELAKKEIEGNPEAISGYILLAEIYKKQEKYLEAEKLYKKAQKINPKNVDVLIGIAYISFMKSQYEIALDLFQKAKRYEPGRAETYKLLGDVYRKIGQSSLAVESYKMFLELSPRSRYKENLQNYIRMMQ